MAAVAEPTGSSKKAALLGGLLLRVAIGLHIVAITSWSLPDAPNAVRAGVATPYGTDWLLYWNQRELKHGIIQKYLFFSGFWQYWDMFAPDPADTDFWCDASVTYKDGSVRRYEYPRMFALPIAVKYFKERFRKFYERAHPEDYAYVWPVFAQRVAFEMDRYPGNPPVRVQLTRHWQPLPGPGKPIPREYNAYTYFDFKVEQAALSRARVSP